MIDGDEFQQTLNGLFGKVRIDFAKSASRNDLVSGQIGACRLTRVETEASVVTNTASVSRTRNQDQIKILMQHSGSSVLQQEGRAIPMERGQIAIYDPTRPFVLNSLTPVCHVVLQIPRQALSTAMIRKLAEPYSVANDNCGMRPVLLSTAMSCLEHLEHILTPSRQSVGQIMIDFVRTALVSSDDGQGGETEQFSLLRRKIVNFISDNVDNTELNAEMIARSVNCCVRYVYKAFEGEHNSLSDVIWDKRLELAARRLAAPNRSIGGISDVAFESGFSSSAHFSRTFRKKFGLSPSEWRKHRATNAA